MKFTEAQLEQAFISLLEAQGYPHVQGEEINRGSEEVLIREDLQAFLQQTYADQQITPNEVFGIVRDLEKLPASDLYETNKTIMNWVRDGFLLKREDRNQKDIFIQLIDYERPKKNIFKIVNQLEIQGFERRIPDGILYINGLPLVVFEFKSAIREEASLHSAYVQLTIRYERDIPDLFKYNAFCIIGDGVNTKAGSFFAPYEFFYAWRKIEGLDQEIDPRTGISTKVHGIDSMYTLIKGMLDKHRLVDIIHNFIYLPDSSKKNEKILWRYPQYYAATKLFENIKLHQLPHGDGKGGTYFGATGCGKSFTMLFLTRLLMKSVDFASPTIVLITDCTDLDDQLSGQFTDAKGFVGDNVIKSVGSRVDLRAELKGRNSGGVFLTTIHKFNEDTELLTERSNVICISDEAHRSQINLEQKVRVTEEGVKKSFGFAKHLHDSLPNATYVGFTGTPIDGTMEVFGEIVDTYTMTESVMDDITVRIVYEGRAAKVLLENRKLQEIEKYYRMVADDGGNEYQIDESKQQMAQMGTILGDPGRIKAIANDFVTHYEARIEEGSTVKGKAMFVCSTREIAYQLYKEIIALRPEWAEVLVAEAGVELTEKDTRELKPMARIHLVMTRGKDDVKDMYDALGT
jgi:type I restriction enzyme R subunit